MISKQELKRIAAEYGTPSYIFDVDELAARITKMKEILGDGVKLCFAMKANPFLVDAMKTLIGKFEVCSPGEFSICEHENVDMRSVVLSGVNKEKADIEHVMDDCGGVGIYTVESFQQLKILSECATARKKKISVLLRLTSGNQFGMSEEMIESIIADYKHYKYVDFRGIQCYTGTQKKKISHIEKELDWLDGFCDRLLEKYGYQAVELEYGPGLPVSYFQPDLDNENYEMLEAFSRKLDSIRGKYEITLEMGRYMAATCGVYISRIADMKENNGQHFCIIDGGINHVNYYGQTMAMKIPQIDFIPMHKTDTEDEVAVEEKCNCDCTALDTTGEIRWNICGSLCTVADVVIKNLPLTNAKLGDMIAFYNIGAYSVTEGIYLFLSRKLPKVLVYDQEKKEHLLRDNFPTDVINSTQLMSIQ